MTEISYKKYHRDKIYSENENLFKNIFEKRFEIAKPHFAKVSQGRVLEIGASNGVMLDIFAENGWQTWGVEPSASAQRAKRKGHRIITTFFEKADLPENYFDAVIANHTLEHMDNPVLVLKKIHRLLKKDGIVYVDVPNAGGLGAKILGKHWPYRLPLEHKHQFTKQSLSKVFREAGFEVIHFESRSGLFEFADPMLEVWQSLVGMKKRFFTNIFMLPYSFLVTLFNSGDSMSMVGIKK